MTDRKLTVANALTLLRILCGTALLFISVGTAAFWSVYLTGGISDMIDGTVARKTHTESKLGSDLDTAADIVFISACLIKLVPTLSLSSHEWIWLIVIALHKAVNGLISLYRKNPYLFPHSLMNKAVGVILFAFPIVAEWFDTAIVFRIMLTSASLGAILESITISAKTARLE